jgi:hypothetical protein
MKRSLFLMTLFMLISCTNAQEIKPIKLNAPDLNRGEKVMKALANRKSTREFSEKNSLVSKIFPIFFGLQMV